MSVISAQAPRLRESIRLKRLAAMLRNTLRNYPMARLRVGKGAFGASLDETTSIYVRYSGNLTHEGMRDFLVMFGLWCAVDGDRIMPIDHTVVDGVSYLDSETSRLSNGRQV